MPSKLQDVDSPSLDDWFTSPVTPQVAASVPLALIGSELCCPFYILRSSFVIFDDVIVRTINNLVDFRSGIRPKTRNWNNNFSYYNSKQFGSEWSKKKIFDVNENTFYSVKITRKQKQLFMTSSWQSKPWQFMTVNWHSVRSKKNKRNLSRAKKISYLL